MAAGSVFAEPPEAFSPEEARALNAEIAFINQRNAQNAQKAREMWRRSDRPDLDLLKGDWRPTLEAGDVSFRPHRIRFGSNHALKAFNMLGYSTKPSAPRVASGVVEFLVDRALYELKTVSGAPANLVFQVTDANGRNGLIVFEPVVRKPAEPKRYHEPPISARLR
jgi:hypothetical protein